MSKNTCDNAIKTNFPQMEQIFQATLAKSLESSSLGNAIQTVKAVNTKVSPQLSGTNNTNINFNQQAWDLWQNYWYNNTQEAFTGDIPTMKMLDEAINARHQALRATNSFSSNCNNNVANVMTEFKNKELNDFNKLNNYMTSLLTSYKHLFDYKSTIKAAYNEKMNSFTNIQNKIDSYKQNLFIDERKNSYQNSSYDFYKSAHFFVLIIYFSLLALYLIFSDFIKEQRYKERKNIIGLFSYIITPFILGYVLDNIYKIYIFILEYNNIRDDVISYPYIVDKFNKDDDEI